MSTVRRLAVALTMTVIAVPATASTFDGAWLVEVVAGKGPCQGVYAFPVSVTGGKITYTGTMAMQASGGIDGRGRVRAALNNGRDRLSATGALRDSSGTGTWSAPSRGCSGRWEARRR